MDSAGQPMTDTVREPFWPILIMLGITMVVWGGCEAHVPGRPLEVVVMFVLSAFQLWFLGTDAANTGTRRGSVLPVLIILFSPLGWLWWGIRSRGKRWWVVMFWYMVIFCVSILVFSLAFALSYIEPTHDQGVHAFH